jgi:hypothetical protein
MKVLMVGPNTSVKYNEARQLLKDAGVKVLKFTGPEAKRLNDIAEKERKFEGPARDDTKWSLHLLDDNEEVVRACVEPVPLLIKSKFIHVITTTPKKESA